VRRLRRHFKTEVFPEVDVVTPKWRPSDLGLQLPRSPTLVSLRPDVGRPSSTWVEIMWPHTGRLTACCLPDSFHISYSESVASKFHHLLKFRVPFAAPNCM
jgi:hypothetical protein